MSSESWQLQQGLAAAGYRLVGRGFDGRVYLRAILGRGEPPAIVILADKREWDPRKAGCFDRSEQFFQTELLAQYPEIFRVTVLKDAHQDPSYHRAAAEEIGCHAWITYYHSDQVARFCPWIRPEHLLRTYHSIDPQEVPPLDGERYGAIISGALGKVIYPLRERIVEGVRSGALPQIDWLRHPGYGAAGCGTPAYLEALSRYKVSICTSSFFAYALRKLIESTACGCRVITDLPAEERLPAIDRNLVRVPATISLRELERTVRREIDSYDPERQRFFAAEACRFYDYRTLYGDLARRIDQLRRDWGLGIRD